METVWRISPTAENCLLIGGTISLINPLGAHLFEIISAIMGLCILNKVHENTEIICSVATNYSQINKNEHVKYCLSFNDVSERHVRLWPNKCMTCLKG